MPQYIFENTYHSY